MSSTTLAGLPFHQLTRTTKRTIEAAIQARLGALRVSATYHAHERARSRRLKHGGEAHTGDTVVEWDAVFASAADATAAKEASVASFDDELAEELAADPSFDGVTVITSTFVSPGETPAAPPADGSESGSAVVAANEEGGDGAAAEVDGTVSSQSVGSLVVMVGICCAPPLLFLALMAKRVSEKLGHVSDEPMPGEFDPEDGGDAGGDGTLDAPKPFTGRYDSGEEDSSLSSDEGSSGEEAKFEGGDGDVELTVIRGASGDDEGDEEDGSNDDTTTV